MSDSFLLPTSAVFSGADEFDRIHQSVIDLTLDPPDYEDIKNLIGQCFELLNNPDTNPDLCREITSLIVSASKAFPENLWPNFEKIYPRLLANEDFPNKKSIVICFCNCIHSLIHINKTPRNDDLNKFYDLILEELKKISPDFTKNITIFSVPLLASSLVKIALMTHPFTEENLKPFVSYLFSNDDTRAQIKYKTSTIKIFSEAPANVFLKVVPHLSQSPTFLSFLPPQKAIEILDFSPVSKIKEFSNYHGWSRLEKNVLLFFFNKLIHNYSQIKHIPNHLLAEIFPKFDITDFTDEMIANLAKCKKHLPTNLLQQITTYEDTVRFLPIIPNFSNIPDEICVRLITEAKDAKSLVSILKLKPRLSILSEFKFWLNIAQKYGMELKGCFKDTFIMNVANFEQYYPEIIKSLPPDVAFMILNEIIQSRIQTFMNLARLPEYIELLRIVNKPIYPRVALDFDLRDLPFSSCLDENTPAPIWFLYALSSFIHSNDRFTIKMPPLPNLTDETKLQILQTTSRSLFNVTGKDPLMFVSAVLLTSYAQSRDIKFKIATDSDTLLFIALCIKSTFSYSRSFSFLFGKSIFEGSNDSLINILQKITPPLNEIDSKIGQYILNDVKRLSNMELEIRFFVFIIETFQQLMEQKIFELNPELMPLISQILDILISRQSTMVIKKASELVNQYLEPFVYGLFQAHKKPFTTTMLKLNKDELLKVIPKLSESNKEFKDYSYCYSDILPELFQNQQPPEQQPSRTDRAEDAEEEEEDISMEEDNEEEEDYLYDEDPFNFGLEEEDLMVINPDDFEFPGHSIVHLLERRMRRGLRPILSRRSRYTDYSPEDDFENHAQQIQQSQQDNAAEEQNQNEEDKLSNPAVIAKHAKLSPTDVLRSIYSLEQVIKIISTIDKKYVGVIESLLINLLRDDDTNTQYIQFMLGKIDDPFCVQLEFIACTFFNYFNRPQSLAKAFDSLYVPTVERKDTYFRRVQPLELKPPSEYSMTLLNSILDLVETKPTYVVFEALFFLAQFYLPLFKYTKRSCTDIFKLVFDKMSYTENDQYYSPFIPAAVFLDNLLEQPQFSDAFFDWVFEGINDFSELQLVVALSLIQAKLKRPKTIFISITKLMRANWPQYPPQLLVKTYSETFNSIILNRIIDITSIFFNAMINMNDNSALAYQPLLQCSDAFTKIFASLPMESLFRQMNIINYLPFGNSSDSLKIFSYRPRIAGSSNNHLVKKLNDIVQANPRTSDQLPDDLELPPSINPEAFFNMPELMQSTILQTILYQNRYTQDFQMQAACEQPWVDYVLKIKPRLLMLPSHYLKVFQVLKRAQDNPSEDFPSQDTIALEYFLQPDLISCLTKISLTENLKVLIHVIAANPFMSEALIGFVNDNLENGGKGVFYTLVYIINCICETNMKDSIKENESLISQLLHYGLMVKNITHHVLIKLAHILTTLDIYPKQVSHLIGYCLIQNTSSCVANALQIYKKLSKEQQADVAYMINNAFKNAIKTRSSQLSQFITSCPEMAVEHSTELLEFLDSILEKGIPEGKLNIIGAIINALAPEPGSLSLSSAESSFKTSISTSSTAADPQSPTSKLPLPQSVIAQNPDFWNLIAKHIDKLRKITQMNPDLIQTTFSFFTKYPKLLSFEQRHKYLTMSLSNILHHGNTVTITVHRNSILEDTFKSIGLSPPEKFKNYFRVTYVGERGTDAGGLTVDWFVKVVQQLFNPIYGLFIPTENGLSFQPFVNSAINMDQHLKYFTFAGRFIARAIIQDTPVPAHLTHGVLKKILGHSLTLRDLEVVDPQLYNSLTYIRDNCADYIGLNFTREIESFGRHYTVKLKKDGDQIDVTDENKEEYIQLMLEHRLYGQTKAQIDAFVNGFLSIIPRESLKSFTSNELDLIICGLPDISIDDLEQNVEFMGPYTHQSQTIKDLFAILRSWDTTKRSLFLIFVTSSSNVPVGGFGQMSNRFRICYVQDVKHLPEAHTCFNQLDLPDYRSYSTLEEKLLFAIQNTESFEKA